jgi:putative oxidoreductase
MNRLSVDFALLLLRMAGVYLCVAHGWGKLMRLLSGDARFADALTGMGLPMPAALAWAAALSEVVGGLLVAVGLFTRVAASLCAMTMFVAAFVRHHAHDLILWKVGLLKVPAERLEAWGSPELAVVYLLIFLALALAGGGGLALDRMLGGRRGRR